MSNLDLTKENWCLHHMLSIEKNSAAMDQAPAYIHGANTDVTLQFTAIDLSLAPSTPVMDENLKNLISAMAMQGTWYRGEVIADDPHSAVLDKTRGQYWAKVFPETHEDRHGILIIQQNYALPASPPTNGETPVRLFTGQYILKDDPKKSHFFGHGADNWAWGLFSFTLTPGACAPSLIPT